MVSSSFGPAASLKHVHETGQFTTIHALIESLVALMIGLLVNCLVDKRTDWLTVGLMM